MAKKVLRQGMQVSIKELQDLADLLLKECKEAEQKLDLKFTKLLEMKRLIPIINKSPNASDTWEIDQERMAPNKRFLELLKRTDWSKKKITPEQINEIIQEVRYGKKANTAKKINPKTIKILEKIRKSKHKPTMKEINKVIEEVRRRKKER